MLTSFVCNSALANCVGGAWLLLYAAILPALTSSHQKISSADLDDEKLSTNSNCWSGRGAGRPLNIPELSKEEFHDLPSAA
jgi:hypothetical protein